MYVIVFLALVVMFCHYVIHKRKLSNLKQRSRKNEILEREKEKATLKDLAELTLEKALENADTTTGTGNVFIYDLVTRSWVEGANNTFQSTALTNLVVDWNNDLDALNKLTNGGK